MDVINQKEHNHGIYYCEPCPYPAIVMLETMPQLQKGEILELLSDCAQSINNIPIDTKNHGYTLLSVEQDGTKLRYLIQR